MEDFNAPPRASSLIESMRDIGYSFETALADIIDNSITAKSGEVDIFCDADGAQPVIAILDDGIGMSRGELLDAMRPGSQNPLSSRATGDLGRFGLGMKTASFSQCRRLTVVTRNSFETTGACWDLDYVAKSDEWMLQVLNSDEIADMPFFGNLRDRGTLVIWEKLDRLSDATQKTSLKDHLYEQLDRARRHLELVFHRFLSGERPFSKLRIRINSTEINAFDPFNANHLATIHQPTETILVAGAPVSVKSFVLPHHNKATKSDWQKYAGDGGYLRNQGFYVYRAGRLIVHGTWFRLTNPSELTKLARVRVDIPTDLDHLWKIDVKKASASPPLIVRQRLKAIIDKIAGASSRVYTQRGAKLSSPGITPFWQRRIDKNQISYEINRDHPTMASFTEELDDTQARQFDSLLSVVEKTFPMDTLYSDLASKAESVDTSPISDATLKELISLTVRCLRDSASTDDQIIEQMAKADPYRSNWKVAESMVRYELGDDSNA